MSDRVCSTPFVTVCVSRNGCTRFDSVSGSLVPPLGNQRQPRSTRQEGSLRLGKEVIRIKELAEALATLERTLTAYEKAIKVQYKVQIVLLTFLRHCDPKKPGIAAWKNRVRVASEKVRAAEEAVSQAKAALCAVQAAATSAD